MTSLNHSLRFDGKCQQKQYQKNKMLRSIFAGAGRAAVKHQRTFVSRSAMSQNVVFHTDPTVTDDSVNITFIDYLGERHSVKGRVGQTLVDVCRMHDMDLLEDDSAQQGGAVHHVIRTERWTEDLFGEDVQSTLSHVILPQATMDLVDEPKHTEVTLIDAIDNDVKTTHSRIGACITLTPQMNGCEIYVPDPPPSDLP